MWVILSAGILTMLGFAVSEHKKNVCKQVVVKIAGNEQRGFINENEIFDLIVQHHDSLTGMYLDSINTLQIKETLLKNPYIKNAQITKTIFGSVKVKVERYEPLIRIINLAEEHFYISRDGTVLPSRKNFVPRIITATGFINTSFVKAQQMNLDLPEKMHEKPNDLAAIRYLAAKLAGHPNLNNYIRQIYINNKGEIEMVPASGGYFVILGDISNLDIKLRNFIALHHANYLKEPVKFSSINLKYTNQVVCKK
jgi:cell division protein FtsQ